MYSISSENCLDVKVCDECVSFTVTESVQRYERLLLRVGHGVVAFLRTDDRNVSDVASHLMRSDAIEMGWWSSQSRYCM